MKRHTHDCERCGAPFLCHLHQADCTTYCIACEVDIDMEITYGVDYGGEG